MPAIPQGLGDVGSAQTRLRRAMRIDSQQLPTSVLSFVGKHSDKHRPSRIVNGLGEVGPRQSLH
ncbi:MAG TPA: hypothetical protein VKB47_13135, partial [Terracidiphilus sp.]|nr:hypothetical protein [Terracidiphilus sp.]